MPRLRSLLSPASDNPHAPANPTDRMQPPDPQAELVKAEATLARFHTDTAVLHGKLNAAMARRQELLSRRDVAAAATLELNMRDCEQK